MLVDLRGAAGAPTPAEVRALAAVQSHPAGFLLSPVALVVGRRRAEATAVLARRCRSRGAACRAFRTEAAALAWLADPRAP